MMKEIWIKIKSYINKQSPKRKNLIFTLLALILMLIIVPPISNLVIYLLEGKSEDMQQTSTMDDIISEDVSDVEYVIDRDDAMSEITINKEKELFKEQNIISISDMSHKDDWVTFNAKNNSQSTIYGLSISVVDENKEEISFVEHNNKTAMKAGDSTSIEFINRSKKNNLKISKYSYSIKKDKELIKITVDLLNERGTVIE